MTTRTPALGADEAFNPLGHIDPRSPTFQRDASATSGTGGRETRPEPFYLKTEKDDTPETKSGTSPDTTILATCLTITRGLYRWCSSQKLPPIRFNYHSRTQDAQYTPPQSTENTIGADWGELALNLTLIHSQPKTLVQVSALTRIDPGLLI